MTSNKVFFTNGGADANENAIRMARLHTGRHKVLATYRSYHGATAGAITLTGDPRRWGSEPGMPGVVHFWGPYLYRSAFHAADRGGGDRPRAPAPARHDHGRGPGDGRGDRARDGGRDQRDPRPAARLPRRCPRHLRRARHPAHRRRGHGRLRSLRRVVRRRPLGRHAGPDHLRQGRELRLRPARRGADLRPGRGDVRRPALPRRAHLLRSPARLRLGGRLDQHHARGGDHRARPRPRRAT